MIMENRTGDEKRKTPRKYEGKGRKRAKRESKGWRAILGSIQQKSLKLRVIFYVYTTLDWGTGE